jgi:hypothetical protein
MLRCCCAAELLRSFPDRQGQGEQQHTTRCVQGTNLLRGLRRSEYVFWRAEAPPGPFPKTTTGRHWASERASERERGGGGLGIGFVGVRAQAAGRASSRRRRPREKCSYRFLFPLFLCSGPRPTSFAAGRARHCLSFLLEPHDKCGRGPGGPQHGGGRCAIAEEGKQVAECAPARLGVHSARARAARTAKTGGNLSPRRLVCAIMENPPQRTPPLADRWEDEVAAGPPLPASERLPPPQVLLQDAPRARTRPSSSPRPCRHVRLPAPPASPPPSPPPASRDSMHHGPCPLES